MIVCPADAALVLESVALEDRERLQRADERQSEPRRLRMRRTLYLCAGINRGCVLRGRDVDMADRITDPLLEDRF